jgi:hypothetical protein
MTELKKDADAQSEDGKFAKFVDESIGYPREDMRALGVDPRQQF